MKKYSRGFVSINYGEDEDENPSSFKGVDLHLSLIDSNEPPKTAFFKSDDPLIAWYECMKFIYINEVPCAFSSSVNHWLMDDDKYMQRYFDPNTSEFIETNADNIQNVQNNYPFCIFSKKMKNFKELREYYTVNQQSILDVKKLIIDGNINYDEGPYYHPDDKNVR